MKPSKFLKERGVIIRDYILTRYRLIFSSNDDIDKNTTCDESIIRALDKRFIDKEDLDKQKNKRRK